MNIAMSRNLSSTSMVTQTYFLLGVGLLLSTISANSSLNSQFSLLGYIGILVGSLALMFGAMFLKRGFIALACFFGFTSLMGLSIGPVINHYLQMANGPTIVAQAIGTTAVITFGLSAYAFISGRSFNQLHGFLFAGLLVVLVAAIANIFLQSSIFSVVISCVSALVFCGYILYDTSRILSGQIASPIEGAISMFLNIFNLFLDLLRILSFFSGSDD